MDRLRNILEEISKLETGNFKEPVDGDSSEIYEDARCENGKFVGKSIPTWWGAEWYNSLATAIRLAKEGLALRDAENKDFIRVAKPIDVNPLRNCDVFRTREACDKAYDKYAKWNMYDHMERNDLSASCLEYEDWFLADYNPKFYYQPYQAKKEGDDEHIS